MMAPAASPPMMPAAIPPPRASAGCGAATAATASVTATARAVRVLVILVMTHLLSISWSYRLNDRAVYFLRFLCVAVTFVLVVRFRLFAGMRGEWGVRNRFLGRFRGLN